MNQERLGFNPEGEGRVDLENLVPMALMAATILAHARKEVGLSEARRIVAEAAAQLENLR